MTKKGPRVTNIRTVRVPAGKTRRVALQVKPKFTAGTAASKKLVIQLRTKVAGKGKAKTTYKKVRISQG